GVGVGLSVLTVFTLGGAVGLQVLHSSYVSGCYRGVYDADSPIDNLAECERQGLGYRYGARAFQLLSIPVGALGGHFLGRGAANRDMVAGLGPRSLGAIAGPGGALLGLGVLSLLITRGVMLTDWFKNRCAHEGFETCANKNQLVIDGSADLSYAAITFGALMLTYAAGYKRERGLASALTPSVGRGYAGLSLTGRF
ncbi:MAG: hypothetical protein KC468_38510, partial [Myxococcales bacterium]|nr:hypothetical protein [Myxococcales bacterium]